MLGALFAGIIFSLTVGKAKNTNLLFKVGLSLIGAGIGINIDVGSLIALKGYVLPLFISIPLTILFSFFLAEILFKGSDLDYKTSLFSCFPGGASEVIGMSKDVGANEQIVTAFHTSRIILFVLCIPLIVGATRKFQTNTITAITTDFLSLNITEIISILLIIIVSIYLSILIKMPVGTLLYAMLIGFLVNQFIDLGNAATILPVVGQVIIGAIIGQKFDLTTAKQLKQLGLIWMKVILLLFGFSFIVGFLFSAISNLSYASSLLGTVPAGAAEMSSTAFALNLDPSIIAALQTLRLLTVFLLLPYLVSFAGKRDLKLRKSS